MQDSAEENGINYATDFYNLKHANVHGSNKFTTYLCNYLQDTYGFTDKRGKEGYEDWQAADQRYYNFIRMTLFDFEIEHAAVDTTLPFVTPTIKVDGDRHATLTWDGLPQADAYYVYRRRQFTDPTRELIMQDDLSAYQWKQLAVLPAGSISFEDEEQLGKKQTFYYAVIPATIEGDVVLYGSGSTKGTAVKVG